MEVCEGGLEVGDEVEAVGVVGSADKPSRRPSRLTQADDTLIMVGDQVSGGMSGGAIMKGGRLAGVISAKIGDSYSKAVGVGRIRGMIQRFSERMAK